MKELSGVKCKTRRGMHIDGDDGGGGPALAEAEAKRSTTYNGGCVVGCEATLIPL